MHEQARNEDGELMLVTLMQKGNQFAFQRIYESYWERLFAYTYNRLHVRAASEEVVQDVFCSLWAKRETIHITSSLSGYLFAAVRHRLLNELRSAKLRKAYAADFTRVMKDASDNATEEHQAVMDLENIIEAKLAQLPKQCQTVFRLSRQEHIPNPTIAQKLKISTKTVENYITAALKHIRASLGEFLVLLILLFF